jgi:flagellar hook protein FlgE
MFAGVAGLRNHQVKMDVLSNNISNVNTFGFKASRTAFSEMFTQTLAASTAPGSTGSIGGLNPRQIGLGVQTNSIDVIHSQGATQTTDRGLDLVIDGEGFFVVREGENIFYTRAGNLYLDSFGYLVNADGLYVQGKMLLSMENVTEPEVEDGVNIMEPSVAERLQADGLIAWSEDGKDSPVNEQVTAMRENSPSEGLPVRRTEDVGISEVFGAFDPGGESEAGFLGRIVVPAYYRNIAIGQDGVIVGEDENGEIVGIAVIVTATFVNPSGLERVGGNLYRETSNSGGFSVTLPGDDVNGLLTAGALEMSNVDMSKEFTEMIITQRGFQANSRIITVSDTLLEELVNLKR